MTTVDRLGGTTSVNDDDLLVLYKRNNRRTRNVSAQDFANFAADSAPVQSVNNKTGEVQLDTDDIPEGAANLYFTDARASAAAPVQSVNTQTGDVVLDAASVGADPAGTAASSMADHVAAPDPHPQYLTGTEADALYAKTASNLGAGAGVFASKVGTTLQLKSLVAGANITLTPSGSEIQIAASATDLLNTTRIDVSSASTVNLTTAAPNTRHINITGTTTITAFTVAVGQTYFVRFAGALTLTNNAVIVTQSGANIVTQAGDTCIIRANAANTVEVLAYTPFKNQALGYEQTWQDVKASRAAGVTYTNTTGKPIEVVVVYSGVNAQLELQVNGATVWRQFSAVSSGSIYQGARVLVPAGATYGVVGTSGTLHSWTELR